MRLLELSSLDVYYSYLDSQAATILVGSEISSQITS